MENFITGYPGCEHQIREALKEAIGEKKQALFFDKVGISRVCFDSLISLRSSSWRISSPMRMLRSSRALVSTLSVLRLTTVTLKVRFPTFLI